MSNSHTICVTNDSTVLTDQEVTQLIYAWQHQISYHFKPQWNVGAILHFFTAGQILPKGAWHLAILDDSTVPGALGYHDLTDDGKPRGFVFAKTDLDNGYNPGVTGSHEILELLVDPYANLAAQVNDLYFYGYELCDPCEADELGYEINGVLVSDFILPAWFFGGAGPFDYKRHITSSLQVLQGGYASVFDIELREWIQVDAQGQKVEQNHRAGCQSRHEKRNSWMH